MILGGIAICIIVSVVPFFIRSDKDDLFSTISLSLTAICAIGTILTLVFAIIIFDRFSLKGKFLDSQTNKVFDLIDELKGKSCAIYYGNGKGIIYVRFTGQELKNLNGFEPFESCRKNQILMNYEDLDKSTDKLLEISRSYWLPEEIKSKMEFLNIGALLDPVDYLMTNNYTRLRLGEFSKDADNWEWCPIMPELTIEQFVINIDNLIIAIEEWLSKHSDIKLNLNLIERERYES